MFREDVTMVLFNRLLLPVLLIIASVKKTVTAFIFGRNGFLMFLNRLAPHCKIIVFLSALTEYPNIVLLVLPRYHLYRSILPASILKRVNNSIVNPHNEDPPYEKNGKGIPITGHNPITIPMFIVR